MLIVELAIYIYTIASIDSRYEARFQKRGCRKLSRNTRGSRDAHVLRDRDEDGALSRSLSRVRYSRR